MPFISIQLNSNRPEQIARFFDSIEATADKPEDIEVLLHIDTGDTVMEAAVAMEKARRKFDLHILQTDLVKGYATLWMPLNPLLKLTHPEAYFLINLSDEMLFETKGWDTILRPYVGYYPDHIFRLRGSKYRYRNYTDFWENGFAPDSLAFYTRRWLELSGDWNPCLGPDSFQQCVSYYLFTDDKFSHIQHNRDIALPHMKFTGEGAGIGLEGEALYRRVCINNRAWFVLMSHKMQQEARRRAMRMKAHILAYQHGNAKVIENEERRHFIVENEQGVLITKLSYKLSWLRTSGVTWLRAPLVLYYAGGGKDALRHHKLSSVILMLSSHTPFLRGGGVLAKLGVVNRHYRAWRARMRHPYNHCMHRTRERFVAAQRLIEHYIQYIERHRTWESGKEYKRPYAVLIKSILRAIFYRPMVWLYRVLRSTLMVLPKPLRQALKPADRLLRRTHDIFLACANRVQRVIIIGPSRIRHKLLTFVTRFVFYPLLLLAQAFLRGLYLLYHARLPHRHPSVLEEVTLAEIPELTVAKEAVHFSIQLSSNKPDALAALLDNIEASADEPQTIEVLVHIDQGDDATEAVLLAAKNKYSYTLRYIKTDIMHKFTDLWMACNALFKETHPSAYFVSFISDEMRFETKGWDTMVKSYIGYYPDHVFRLRASKYRFRNYTDVWENGFAPDSVAFHTRHWLALQGNWNPCTGPDSFQQCVSYYLFTSDPYSHTQYMRDIALPFMHFSGEGASIGLEGEAKEKRIRENNRAWFELMSPAMQQEAKRRAMLLKAYIIKMAHPQKQLSVKEDRQSRAILIQDGKNTVELLRYGVSTWRTRLLNLRRAPWVHRYAGGGDEIMRTHPWNGARMMINTYSPTGRKLLKRWDDNTGSYHTLRVRLHHGRNHVRGRIGELGLIRGGILLVKDALRYVRR